MVAALGHTYWSLGFQLFCEGVCVSGFDPHSGSVAQNVLRTGLHPWVHFSARQPGRNTVLLWRPGPRYYLVAETLCMTRARIVPWWWHKCDAIDIHIQCKHTNIQSICIDKWIIITRARILPGGQPSRNTLYDRGQDTIWWITGQSDLWAIVKMVYLVSWNHTGDQEVLWETGFGCIPPGLSDLENPNTYAGILFVDFCSAFNSINPCKLVNKLQVLGLQASQCLCIKDFLTNRPQHVRLGHRTSSTVVVNTGVPQGCVLGPLIFSLFTSDCVSPPTAPIPRSNSQTTRCHSGSDNRQ